jgi:hypothetical protein
VLLIVPALTLSQPPQENRTLVVNGQPAEVSIIQINGRAHADLETLARAIKGSGGIKGTGITLTLPGSIAINQAPTSGSSPAPNSQRSKEFVS